MSDPADSLLDGCARSAVLSPLAAPSAWPLPNTRARDYDFAGQAPPPLAAAAPDDADRARRQQEFNDLLAAAQARMFPPHLYPPLRSAPYILRADETVALPASAVHRAVLLDWTVPAGTAFTVQELHLRAHTGGVACAVGFTIDRNQQRVFAGDELRTLHPDGAESVQPPILPLAGGDPATAWITAPCAVTFLSGERVTLTAVATPVAALTLTLHLQLRGYTYPSEDSR
jgi:hypothetical protein